jgi:hypothetical protein
MKLIKSIMFVFMVSTFLAVTGTNASGASVGYSDITISALGGTYTTSAYDKTKSGPKQRIYTTDMTTSMKARTYSTLSPSGYSDWINLQKKAEQDWGNQNSDINQYKLQIKCTGYNLLNEKYWGIWKYNWPE